MMLPWAQPLAAARARLSTEDSLRRRVRLAVRALWDAAMMLEAASSPAPDPAAISAIRREALRLATQALPIPALADTADAMLSLSKLMEHGLDEFHFADVPAVLALAREAHERALTTLETTVREVSTLVRRQQVALGTLVLMVCLVSSVAGRLLMIHSAPTDLAAGKPFTLSSKWADCHPEQNECGNFPTRIAFHTLSEQSPWYQVDFGAPTSFSSATIVNRQDMAMPLAVPLVLEVSDDGKTFREVARHTEVFTTWWATFPPQTARYFRARVDRLSTLHLEAVRVHP
jgi:hypothetical protein